MIYMLKSGWGLGLSVLFMFAALGAAGSAAAQSVQLTDGMPEVSIDLDGMKITIARNQDQAALISGEFAKTSRPCPSSCIQPQVPVSGVATIGELELIAFLQDKVAAGEGVLLDARLPEWFQLGSIPGAVNVPYSTLSSDNPLRNDILIALGAQALGGDTFDFTHAIELAIFCNGIWSDQAMRALRALRGAGYPAEKLHYYRGGMQDWNILGLTIARADTGAVAGGQQ